MAGSTFNLRAAETYHDMPFEDEIAIYYLVMEYDLDWE